jgi:ABC-type polar amino acid transport system ATPase subunit
LAGTVVPAHRHTHHEACRSTGEHPPAAANTVRAAPEQDSLLLSHEERFARSTSDAVVFMDHGQVVESGSPEQIFDAAETDRLRRFLSQVL